MPLPQALLRFSLVVAAAWLFMMFVPLDWFFQDYLPPSFFLLMGLVTFGVCGLGWPFAAPMGKLWKPDNRLVPGLLMCAVWLAYAVILNLFTSRVFPGVPMNPSLGIIVFGVTLWYSFDGVGPHPFKNKDGSPNAVANWAAATVVIMVVTWIVWFIFVDMAGTPLDNTPHDPNGVFPSGYWFGLMVWIIVWVQVFGGTMCLQGWPFYKLPKPLPQACILVAVIVLGYACWEGGLRLGVSPTFSFGAVGASMIGWSLMHAVAFEMFPFAKHIQPKRGFLNFLLEEIILTAAWIVLLRIILTPVYARMVELKFAAPEGPFDINMLSAFFTLHVAAVILLMHQFFFMRAPWSIPGPPLGPEERPPEA